MTVADLMRLLEDQPDQLPVFAASTGDRATYWIVGVGATTRPRTAAAAWLVLARSDRAPPERLVSLFELERPS